MIPGAFGHPGPMHGGPPPGHGGAPFPCYPPQDPALHDRINKLCEHVAQRSNNGDEFIKLVKTKEANNPEFAFLFPGQEGHAYYQWKKYCLERGMDETHGMPPQAAPPPAPPRPPNGFGRAGGSQFFSEVPPMPNTIPLGEEEKKELSTILTTIEGSKESIKRAGAWIMDHRAQCADCILVVQDTMKKIPFYEFDKKLHLCWLLNDLLHESMQYRIQSGNGILSMDDITKSIANILIQCLQASYAGYRHEQQNKINCLLGLWGQRQIFSPHMINFFGNSMCQGQTQFDQPRNYNAAPDLAPAPEIDPNMWGQAPKDDMKPYSCLHLSPGYVVDVLLTLKRNEGLKAYKPIKIDKLPNYMPKRSPKTPNYILDKYEDFERDLEEVDRDRKRRRRRSRS